MDQWWYKAIPIAFLALPSITLGSESLSSLRERYQMVQKAWDAKQMDTVDSLMPSLKAYPLYPYLEYRQITDNIRWVSPSAVTNFLNMYPDFGQAGTLESRFVNELARRQEWRSIVSFTQNPPGTTEAKCNYYYAQSVTGNQSEAWQGAESVWTTGKLVSNSCGPLFDAWQLSGGLTVDLIQKRILLALKEENMGLVSQLVQRLSISNPSLASGLSRLPFNPSNVVSFASVVTPTPFTRQATIAVFAQYAKKSPEEARFAISRVANSQSMSGAERQQLEDSVALQYMKDVSLEQANWRDSVVRKSQSADLIERRIRLAFGKGDMNDVSQWLAILPAQRLQEDEWQYWKGVFLISQGKTSEGEALLGKLMQGRGFYPMAAAQKLNQAYPFLMKTVTKPDSQLDSSPVIKRIRELKYWDMDPAARSEWVSFINNQSAERQAQLARYAFEQKWADLSVQATITAKLWDHLEERFPLAWEQDFYRYTKDKDIDKSYAMAIARQESAWNPKARSPVGASGLMQLMPTTAKHVADKYGYGYWSTSQLVDPTFNIQLGTVYLESVYQQFGNNRILASAAYNAGPSRVNRWLSNSGGRLDAVAFVESIPFNETRRYVKNVLAYDAYYQYFMGEKRQIMTNAEWSRRY